MYEIKQEGTTASIKPYNGDCLIICGDDTKVICFNDFSGEDTGILYIADFADLLVDRTAIIWNGKLWYSFEVNNRHPNYEFRFKHVDTKNIYGNNNTAKKISMALTVTRAVSPDRVFYKYPELVNGEYASEFWLPVLSKRPVLVLQLLANEMMQKTFERSPGMRKAFINAALEADPFLIDQLPTEVLLHPQEGKWVVDKAVNELISDLRRSKTKIVFDIPVRLHNSPAILKHVLFEIKEVIEQDKADTIDWKRLQPTFGKDKEIRDVLAHSTGFVNWLESYLTVSNNSLNRALNMCAFGSDLNVMAAYHLPKWIDKELMSTICANFAGMEESNIYRVLAKRIIQDRS